MRVLTITLLLVTLGFCNGNQVNYNPPPPPAITATFMPPPAEPPPTITPYMTNTPIVGQPPNSTLPAVTPDFTPTREVILPETSINDNPYFNDIGVTLGNSNRIQDIPRNWSYVANRGSVGLDPFVFRRSYGYRFEVSYINGWFGFSQNVPLQSNQLYILKVVYTEELNLTQGTYQQNPIYFSGFIQGNSSVTLPISNINISSGGEAQEALWVFRPTRTFLATFEVWFYTLYPSYQGALNIRSIEIIPLPSNYTNSFLEVN